MAKSTGYISIWRGAFSHWLAKKKPWCDLSAWFYLCSRANYKKSVVYFREERIHVKKGEFVTSKVKLGKVFGWSTKQVTKFLLALAKDGMVGVKVTNRYTHIYIINYAKYQIDVQKTHNRGRTGVEQLPTENNSYNNLYNKENGVNTYKNRGGRNEQKSPYTKKQPDPVDGIIYPPGQSREDFIK